MPDVTIPADVAKRHAERLRILALGKARWRDAADDCALADLLDPRPASLREQVAEALIPFMGEWGANGKAADAVLAVVADWLATQPLHLSPFSDNVGREWNKTVAKQRDADVALIRGGAE